MIDQNKLNPIERKSDLNEVLSKMTEFLDITASQYEDAVNKYNAIAVYLDNDENINELEPDMYPQGSFSLGTVIKPLNDQDEYDIDLVCELQLGSTSEMTQYALKELIGGRLKSGRYRNMLKDLDGGRRCWTIEYAEDTKLHLDILPALPDNSTRITLASIGNIYAETAINITDKENENFYAINEDWVKSNPKGYQKWFKEQMTLMLNERKRVFAEVTLSQIEDVPDYKVKTPLQRAIQLLKRHRDSFYGDNEDKPISIIITTLAAHAYGNENNLYDALTNILKNMPNFIKQDVRNGKYVTVIENPVDSRENFADKWETSPNKERVFYEWLENAKVYFQGLLEKTNFVALADSLNEGLGKEITKRAFTSIGKETKDFREQGNLYMKTGTGFLSTNSEKAKKVRDHNFYGSEE